MKGGIVPKPKRKTRMIEAILGGDSPQKRPKMMKDRTMTHNCSALLKPLMQHPTAGMVFNPKALKKSDYLTAMENPMDFGIIESKIAKNTYVGGGKDVSCSKRKQNRNSFLPKKSYWQPSESEMPLNAGAVEAEPPKPVQNSVSKLARKHLRKDGGGRAHGCMNAKPPVSQGQGACKRSSCGSIKSQSSIRVSSPASEAASREGLLFEAQKSPKKAFRAAMLKSRYANTIVKAQLLVNVDKADPMKMQQEKAKMERSLCEEKAKAELELKKQREREREAAWIALQNMKNTAGIELNLDVQKEFEILIGCSPSQADEDIEEGEIVS